MIEESDQREKDYIRYQAVKKQRWTQEVNQIEQQRDQENERKKLEKKIMKLMERDSSKNSVQSCIGLYKIGAGLKKPGGKPLIQKLEAA